MRTRREFISHAAAVMAVSAVAPLIEGCTTRTTLEDWVNVIGTETVAIVNELGNTTLASQITQATANIVSAIAAWKPGTPASYAIQALNVLQNLLNLIPAVTVYEDPIKLIVGALDAILALLPASATATAMVRDQRSMGINVRQGTPVKDKADFVKQFNAALVKNKITTIQPIKTSWLSKHL